MTIRKYGWRPDKPDFRDHVYGAGLKQKKPLPLRVDIRETGKLPDVYDQGQTSSCTSQSIAAAIEYGLACEGKQVHVPSRLFIYYNERLLEGTTNDDAGAEIRDGIKSVASDGSPDEKFWPFEPSRLTTKPSDEAYAEAKKGIIKQYSRVPVSLYNIQSVLSHNVPVVFGASLYQSFESDSVAGTGHVPMPDPNEGMVGGHAMLMVGYEAGHFIVRNSWGNGWGDKGYCYIPYAYLTNPYLADDFWAIFVA
jgi:C1A family cysteine protease